MLDRKEARDAEFQSFVVGRWPRLLRTAFLLTGEQHAAEDLVQSTLERAYVAWRRVGAADDPDAYVRRVMINAHARRHRRRLKEFLAPKDYSGPTHELPDADDRIARADDRGALLTVLAALPVRQREAVVLRYWEDLSEEQAAEAMGCSVGTVKSNTARGIAKLRALPGLAEALTSGGRK
ncbi:MULTISPECIES: SigE family RNA polymerase sigma factor [Streptomyces]|uniref:RNA polymerase sigma-70 factor (Sigma-E family) n=1 Tax=Streptomyces stelliscabiei TaxID=146820 RepID=A0A8I0PBY0_9ACTN|nr:MULTISPECIES: SigE family RNA polymerase sigma factor [Streptomyces]KND39986.1 RNA polymerase sigma24 factor [Streptomyces stelliscabiei]MBE1601347.1 RNA polymerase sigma-70 factor (sigma-E family) [Streptomyces stelliscabiei]MDX2516926.1 SigE family RNA polymerase sigma factor [Streptomyces stelliscabiei]MDX2554768.1 SigE family RNA polymerase sigma factor [Streptomyces stelliscabiei]MDX2610811.1 SigE family RNA polymerase sigma factor [Streptomyces stelliscabiei]